MIRKCPGLLSARLLTMSNLLKSGFWLASSFTAFYAFLIGALTIPFFQSHVVYLHKIQLTWFKDLNVPEQFGFLRGQATPFSIRTSENQSLFAWHILPIELYRKHEDALIAEASGHANDFSLRLAFRLLRDDPDALLIVHLHGAAGTVGSGYRVPNYRALSAGQPDKIHVLTFDYRGFGLSSGTPSEAGIQRDAVDVVRWALEQAQVPASRVIIFGQSMGTAVSLAILEHFVLLTTPVVFAGVILVAPFTDAISLAMTYRLAGSIPILSPAAKFPWLFDRLSMYMADKWLSKDRIARYVQTNEAYKHNYRLTLMHAEDDYDIPFQHTIEMTWHAVNATRANGISRTTFSKEKERSARDLGPAGSMVEWRTENGIIREQLLKTGLHDAIMGYPVITRAVMQIFDDLT